MEPKKNLSLIRKPEYLSPSALKMWLEDQDKYFMTYLAIVRPPRYPQTKAMAIGSGFDAYCKTFLSKRYSNSPYDRDALFNNQVEKHNRDLVRADSEKVFKMYNDCGALTSLCRMLDKADNIRFESRITGTVTVGNSSVTIQGVPDMMFELEVPVIFDWKVNGFYSKASPKAGYCNIFPDLMAHKDCYLIEHYGISHNAAWFNNLYPDWALQLSTYSWLCGLPVGNRQMNMIHQLVFDPKGNMRVAVHAGLCEPDYQLLIYNSYVDLWNRIVNDRIFDSVKIEQMNREAETLIGDSPEQDLYRELVR